MPPLVQAEAALVATAPSFPPPDVFEAMMGHRPYRPSLGIEAAMDEIRRGSGSLFDPQAVAACIKLATSGKLPNVPMVEVVG